MNRLADIIAPAVHALNYELWGCELIHQQKHDILRVFVECHDGNSVNLADCAQLSRQVSAVLDVEDPIRRQYVLEISSPGFDRPLYTLAQYQRYIGQKIKLRLKVPRGDRRHFSGELLVVDEHEIRIKTEPKEGSLQEEPWTFRFDEIEKANLQPSF